MTENKFLDLLVASTTPLLTDGAMGTMLHMLGAPLGASFEQLNLTNPALVAQVHRGYIDAGAQIILTNTFGANRYKLTEHGLEAQVADINRTGVDLARRVIAASFKEVLLAGDVGPLGVQLVPFGRVKKIQARRAFKEQIAALIDVGVDLIVIETITDLNEILAAIQATHSVTPEDTTPLPIIASMTFTHDDRTLLGDSPAHVARKIWDAGVTVIGVNCSGGPAQLLRILSQMHAAVPEAAVEMDPPRGLSTHKLLAGANLLAEAGADVINVADNPRARMRMSPWAVCSIIQDKVGIETTLHFPTRGRNLLRVQGDLLAAHALGVRNVFVVMGDPTSIGDYPEAMDNYDLVPSGLIKLIKQGFNAGVDHAGSDIGQPTTFFVGGAMNLRPKDIAREVKIVRRKVRGGVDFFLTQPVYNPASARVLVDTYAEKYGALDVPILVGILPLYGVKHARFLHNEVPGITIAPEIFERLEIAGKASMHEGVRIAIEAIHHMREWMDGVYLMPAFHRYDLAAEIVEACRD